RAGVGGGAAVGVDGDAEPIVADDPVDRAAALPACGVDVVEHLTRVDRGDLVRIVPLRPARLVPGISRDVASGGGQVGVGVDAASETADGVAGVGRGEDSRGVVVLV